MKNKRYLGFIGSSTSLAEMSLDLNETAEEIIDIEKANKEPRPKGRGIRRRQADDLRAACYIPYLGS